MSFTVKMQRVVHVSRGLVAARFLLVRANSAFFEPESTITTRKRKNIFPTVPTKSGRRTVFVPVGLQTGKLSKLNGDYSTDWPYKAARAFEDTFCVRTELALLIVGQYGRAYIFSLALSWCQKGYKAPLRWLATGVSFWDA